MVLNLPNEIPNLTITHKKRLPPPTDTASFLSMLKFTTNTAASYDANIGKKSSFIQTEICNLLDFNQGIDDFLIEEPTKLVPFWEATIELANLAIQKEKQEGKSYIGVGAMRRLKSATNVLFKTANAQGRPVNLLTLTLPSETCKKTGKNLNSIEGDKYLKRVLLPDMVAYLRDTWKMHLYIYRCETQDKGRLHFHFLIDCFAHKTELNKAWNTICSYYLADVQENAPSTRIDGIKDELAMSTYLCKYLTKGAPEGRRNTGGRQWGSCNELKEAKLFTIDTLDSINHDKALYYLEEMHLSYPDQCQKFYICKNSIITQVAPENKYDIVCTSYRFNPKLFEAVMPKDIIDLSNNYYKDYSLQLYEPIAEKVNSYRWSKESKKAFEGYKKPVLQPA